MSTFTSWRAIMRALVPGAWCLVPGAWCLVPGAQVAAQVAAGRVPGGRAPGALVPGPWCVIRATWCVIRATWCVIRATWPWWPVAADLAPWPTVRAPCSVSERPPTPGAEKRAGSRAARALALFYTVSAA
jgi:hypothetical protein